MDSQILWSIWKWQVLCILYMSCWGWGWGQLHYTVIEESEPGTLLGNVASDLGLSMKQISERRLRLGSEENRRYFSIKLESGDLLLNEKIDRENLCSFSSSCLLAVELIIERPLELFRLAVEILDINDNSPYFVNADRVVKMAELAAPGLRFPLESAVDPDVGTNAVRSYQISQSQYFSLNVKQLKDGKLFPELVLENALDREEIREHHLILIAVDGGQPSKTGTTKITVQVLDNNDNPPIFDQSVYKTSLMENMPLYTFLIKLNATDSDEGSNSEIEYSFEDHTSSRVRELFRLDSFTGEIWVQREIDFEESSFYEIYIRAKDKGVPVMEGHCVIQVEIEDSNDNAPEVVITSLEKSIPENTPIGTVVGIFNVNDRDSGKNGEVQMKLPLGLPFKFKSVENHYSLITDYILDREVTSHYTIYLVAVDLGSPPMFTELTIVLNISDVNDNSPQFSHPSFNAYLHENNVPGVLLYTLDATDVDEGENAILKFCISETFISGSPLSSFIYINEYTGNVYAQRSFDYEETQLLDIPVCVEDGGSPKHRSNATLYIFILDQNDNHPIILYPLLIKDTAEHQKVPHPVSAGCLITKVAAVDPDSGYNALLTYTILDATDLSFIRINSHTGEIKTVRPLTETDENTHTIMVMVKDNGEPALSSTATLIMHFEEPIIDETLESQDYQTTNNDQSDLTLYLIISLAAISVVSLVTFVVLTIKCLRTESSQCMCSYQNSSINQVDKKRKKQVHTFSMMPNKALCYDKTVKLSEPNEEQIHNAQDVQSDY
ncbi:Protocadherin gamma-C5 [Pelobates cultripes]|uniref:Protocadherin gamma-C5 n=1 Tax=Pelobates cultripes TaxID=61616 RepID=A0AAD1W037_PELCU|nr:Protocadherin gamma-C5 [Pelobates cultripes]